MGSRRPLHIALIAVVPTMAGLWLFFVFTLPAEHLQSLTLALIIAAGLLILFISLLIQQSRNHIRALASWAESMISGKSDLIGPPATDADGERIMRALRSLARRKNSQNRKRARDKDRLLTVLTYMNDGVMILSKSGYVRLMNPTACKLLEVAFEDVEDKSFVQVVRDYRIAELWRECEAHNVQVMKTIEHQESLIRVVVTPFLRGNARGFLVIFQDMTEVSRLQTVRQSFVTNISHELRTPLASLRALAETLSETALDDPPAARRFLERMEVEVDALAGLVDELSDLSRIESGQMELRRESMSPAYVIRSSVDRLASQAERAQVTLAVEVADTLPKVAVDPDRIQQVLVNLIRNAIRFTPPRGTIEISAVQVANHVTFIVKDNGAGIPQEHLPRLFERFYKVDSSRRSAGSGLGLAISKHIVQAHGGTIWAESEEGRGSTFSFTLPPASLETTHLFPQSTVPHNGSAIDLKPS